MKHTKLSRLIAMAILPAGLVLNGAVYSAAGDDAKSGSTVKEEKARDKDRRSDAARTERQAQPRGDRHWASNLIGKNVAIGEQSGEIKDLIVDTRSGDVRHAVTKISGKGDKGDRLYAVPLRMFQVSGDNKLTLNVDRNWLAQRKSWTEDKWPGMQDRDYWGDAATPGPSAGTEPTPAPGARDRAAGMTSPADGNVHRMSKLINQNVENAQGKNVGEIKDMAVNLKSQKVDFVLVSHDPGVMKAEKQYAVPLAGFQFPGTAADGGDEGKQKIVFNMTDEKGKDMKVVEDKDRALNDPGLGTSR